MGITYNPFSPKLTQNEIANRLLNESHSKEELLRNAQGLSGRFAIFYSDNSSQIVFSDGCGLKQIYYHFDEGWILSSSLKLIKEIKGEKVSTTKTAEEILSNELFRKKESSWLGATAPLAQVKKLLPNHYLDLKTKEVKRIPFYSNELYREKELIDYSAALLEGSYKAITNRYDVILQQLTAGWDSRLLLAASKKFSSKIKYYVFDRTKNTGTDPRIAEELSKKLNLNFERIEPEELTDEFVNKYKQENLFPRVMDKTKNIQYHYYHSDGKNGININGNSAEILRAYYGNNKRKSVSPNILLHLAGYNNKFNLFYEELVKWIESARSITEEYGIPIIDLFYWEQKMGNWGAQAQFEMDIAMDEISPVNNRELLLTVLKIPKQDRIFPKYNFFTKLIDKMWPEALDLPINPDIKGKVRLKEEVKKYTFLNYMLLRALRR